MSRANSWEAPNTASQKEFKMTPTGCNSLAFSPKAEGSMGAPGITDAREFPPVTTTLKFDPEEAALKRAEVILPISLGPNLAAAQRACPREQADASAAPRARAWAPRSSTRHFRLSPCVDPSTSRTTPRPHCRANGDASAAGRREARRRGGLCW